MARIYDLVTRHFIASVSHDAVWSSTKVSVDITALGDNGHFTIRGRKLVSKGFLEILHNPDYVDRRDDSCYDDLADNLDDIEEANLPEFFIGEEFLLTSPSCSSSTKVMTTISSTRAALTSKEKMTSPPSHLTESELISQMERHGIGTDASISTHIENILKRNYAELSSGRKMVPTKLGLVLAQGYHLIDNSLVLPQIRSEIEAQCNRISKGLADKNEIVEKTINMFVLKFENFVKNINKMDMLFSSSFMQLKDVGKPFTRCGLTRRYLQFIVGPPPRLYNKFTESVYPLPSGGIIKEWTGRKCSAIDCNFELCLYSVGQPARTFPLCPNCFNNPKPEWGIIPGNDTIITNDKGYDSDEVNETKIRRLGGKSLILECPHPDRHPLIEELTVGPDSSGNGVLIIDPHFGPKWRLVSTRVPNLVRFPKNVEKLTILSKRDKVSDFRLIRVEFKEDDTPFKDELTQYVTCFPSDEFLKGVVHTFNGSQRNVSKQPKRRRGGGNSRGSGSGRGGGHALSQR